VPHWFCPLVGKLAGNESSRWERARLLASSRRPLGFDFNNPHLPVVPVAHKTTHVATGRIDFRALAGNKVSGGSVRLLERNDFELLLRHATETNARAFAGSLRARAILFNQGGRMLRSLLPITSIVLLGALIAVGQEPSVHRPDGSEIAPSQIDSAVSQLMQAAHVTGTGIAIFRSGKVAYLKTYGYRDTERGLPLTPDSVLTSASLSKAAFATVVMHLAQQRVVDLDKPIYRYLPKPLPDYSGYADLQGDDRYKKLTLRILLSHTSGFPNWRAFEDDRKLKIHFEPGTRYAYSGEGIDLAQLVVETVTGKSITELMDENLFKPLHITRTSMVWEPRFESDFANGYDEYGRSLGPERRSTPNAAGSMQTTLHDYATFLSAVMGRKILSTPTTGKMLSPQMSIHSAHQFPSLATKTTAANDGIRLRYGLGWGLYSSPYGKAFFKEGHDEGWRHLALCFNNGSGILIMTNSSNGEGIFKPLIDSILGRTLFPFGWEGYTPYNLLPPLPKLKEHKTVSLTADQLKRLVGRYGLSPDVILSVTVENGHLFVQENDEPKQELLPESPQDFYSTISSDECSFKLADEGPAQVMVLHLGGKDVELKRLQ
jgi:CubicO group peptidase (beta-lactamase class C family)